MPDDSESGPQAESSTTGPQDTGTAERPLFPHPRWTVGVVLVFAVAAIVAGLNDPVWLLIGFPCILVLIVYVWVRVAGAGRP